MVIGRGGTGSKQSVFNICSKSILDLEHNHSADLHIARGDHWFESLLLSNNAQIRHRVRDVAVRGSSELWKAGRGRSR